MQETKAPRDPKKSLWASYLIIFLLVIGFNALFMPMLARAGVRQVDYGTFLQMLEDGELTTVELNDDEIIFEDSENQLYSPTPSPRTWTSSTGWRPPASSSTRWSTTPAFLTTCSTSWPCSCR